MGVYFGETEITNIDNLVPQTMQDITQAFFGSTEVFTVWAEYDGALPAQYSANRDYLVDYRIYGASGGVGDDSGTAYGYEVDMSVSDGTTSTTIPVYIGSDPLGEDEYVDYVAGKIYRRTAQLFNKNTVVKDCYISLNGEIQNVNYSCSDFIPISAGSYYLKNVTGSSIQNSVVVYDANKRALRYANVSGSYTAKGAITFTDGDAYIRVNIYTLTNLDTVDIIAGSIEPTEHIPYVAPVDPPVPLPALPTVDGVTITDYAGQSAAVPSRFVAKYRKEGF